MELFYFEYQEYDQAVAHRAHHERDQINGYEHNVADIRFDRVVLERRIGLVKLRVIIIAVVDWQTSQTV